MIAGERVRHVVTGRTGSVLPNNYSPLILAPGDFWIQWDDRVGAMIMHGYVLQVIS